MGAQMIVSTERRYSESNISLYMADLSKVHQNHLAKFDVCHIISYPSRWNFLEEVKMCLIPSENKGGLCLPTGHS